MEPQHAELLRARSQGGVIRQKWVGAPGDKAIDTALEKLIDEAEMSSKKSP